jgi:hypothetical protein
MLQVCFFIPGEFARPVRSRRFERPIAFPAISSDDVDALN